MIYFGITILQSSSTIGGFTLGQVTVVVGIVVAVRVAEYAWVHWVSPEPQKSNIPVPQNENDISIATNSPASYFPIQNEMAAENKIVEKPAENSAREVVAHVFASPAKNVSTAKKVSKKKKVKNRTVSVKSADQKPLPKIKPVEEKMGVKKEAEPKPKVAEVKPIPVEVKKEMAQPPTPLIEKISPEKKVEINAAKKIVTPKKIAAVPIAAIQNEKKTNEKKVPSKSVKKTVQKKSARLAQTLSPPPKMNPIQAPVKKNQPKKSTSEKKTIEPKAEIKKAVVKESAPKKMEEPLAESKNSPIKTVRVRNPGFI